MKTLITALALMTFNARAAQDIFLFKKSMNPKNVLHYAVDMKPDCSLNQSVATYWIMGESDGHR